MHHLMETVIDAGNLNRADKRVKANGGAPGVVGMTVGARRGWIAANREGRIASLLDGSYKPQPIRGVSIPKRSAHDALRQAREYVTDGCEIVTATSMCGPGQPVNG